VFFYAWAMFHGALIFLPCMDPKIFANILETEGPYTPLRR